MLPRDDFGSCSVARRQLALHRTRAAYEQYAETLPSEVSATVTTHRYWAMLGEGVVKGRMALEHAHEEQVDGEAG
ncbi:hypothetical protein EAO73_28260 [Streptomyces sp. col6]|uniref:hypothetical protein n=1 Tax=Streptomyces sp. col6 TaxID=2478958 RepID=UPI0011CE3289|nr:hypothetical protein [Streptomyces sp. col6]TXR99807.1 hypothetical protein EAO73_28260 [Streptomyces sp. col6]